MTMQEFEKRMGMLSSPKRDIAPHIETAKTMMEKIKKTYASIQEGEEESENFLTATFSLCITHPVDAKYIEVLGNTYRAYRNEEEKRLAYLDRTFLLSENVILLGGSEYASEIIRISQRHKKYEKRKQAYYAYSQEQVVRDYKSAFVSSDYPCQTKVYQMKKSALSNL